MTRAVQVMVALALALLPACSPGPAQHIEVDNPPELVSGRPFYNRVEADTDDAVDWFVIHAKTEMTVAISVRLDEKEDLDGSIQVIGGNGEKLYNSSILAIGNIPGTLHLEPGPWYVKIRAEHGALEYTIVMTTVSEEP